MRERVKPQTAIEKYEKGVIIHFPKNEYDSCRWNKNLSTWKMLKNRYDNGNRDSQMNKLYNAEYSLIPWADEGGMDFNDVILKITEVVNNTWFRKKFGRLFSNTELKVEYGDPRQNEAYAYGTDFLSLPPQFCNVPIILHELSHIIVDRLSHVVYFKKNYSCHGRMFAFIYLELVKKFMGDRGHLILKTGFKNFNVKYRNRIPQTSAKKRILRERISKHNIYNNENNI
tara:strand:+ start:1279 stop:1962 length:684 start_codon:yes stop_codon:yes gene_type:complete